ncbi:dihydropteroate synthase [uncultured Roseobacter sp.]|uniref:dihydropteroate synthase n=1 Tax=uncultured Roseobacter sp. TaxID=114847 RepID=UPI002619225A|nr:dihydropteroate synthase [uncultured Roseobacter sp.]
MGVVYRPIAQTDPARPETSELLAGGWCWFTHAEVLERGRSPEIIPAGDIPRGDLDRLTRPRASVAGLDLSRPCIMGILNITPDSFSDGGRLGSASAATAAGRAMQAADILDIGGESTRPGAAFVPPDEEIARVVPVISALKAAGIAQPLSVDTRKAPVAAAALGAGAALVNDVSGFTFDADLAPLCARNGTPVCVMHAQGDPATMQENPHYDDVVLDVFDFLQGQISHLNALGISSEQIIADPGIGFGKTQAHNLALLSRLSVFHALGVPVLLGASRKRFIGTIGGAAQAKQRMPGSIAVALAALKHGTQIVRVHDVPETAQAIALWRATVAGRAHG